VTRFKITEENYFREDTPEKGIGSLETNSVSHAKATTEWKLGGLPRQETRDYFGVIEGEHPWKGTDRLTGTLRQDASSEIHFKVDRERLRQVLTDLEKRERKNGIFPRGGRVCKGGLDHPYVKWDQKRPWIRRVQVR